MVGIFWAMMEWVDGNWLHWLLSGFRKWLCSWILWDDCISMIWGTESLLGRQQIVESEIGQQPVWCRLLTGLESRSKSSYSSNKPFKGHKSKKWDLQPINTVNLISKEILNPNHILSASNKKADRQSHEWAWQKWDNFLKKTSLLRKINAPLMVSV